MLGMTAGLAILVPNIQVVFGLLGSTTAVVLNFLTPALMLLVSPLSLPYDDTALLDIDDYTNKADDDDDGRHSLAIAINATSSAGSSSVDTPLLHLGQQTTIKPSRNICATAAGERVIAVGIIALALLIGICGTGVNIYQNFF
jgi:hypothetical protein